MGEAEPLEGRDRVFDEYQASQGTTHHNKKDALNTKRATSTTRAKSGLVPKWQRYLPLPSTPNE